MGEQRPVLVAFPSREEDTPKDISTAPRNSGSSTALLSDVQLGQPQGTGLMVLKLMTEVESTVMDRLYLATLDVTPSPLLFRKPPPKHFQSIF